MIILKNFKKQFDFENLFLTKQQLKERHPRKALTMRPSFNG